MIAMVSSGAQPRRRPFDLQASEPRSARVGAPHDENRRGTRGRRQPADLYALGCVAYFLLVGQEPFTAKTDAGIAMLHLTQTPASLKGRGKGDISDAFERVVMRCLAKSPDDRFASAAQLMRALSELQLSPWTQADAAVFWAEHAAAEDARQA